MLDTAQTFTPAPVAAPTASDGIRVFREPTLAGLAIAAGATLVSSSDSGDHLSWSLADVPRDFDERHRSGDLRAPTREAEFWIKHLVGMIRSQAKLRDRAKMNREVLAQMKPGSLIGQLKK